MKDRSAAKGLRDRAAAGRKRKPVPHIEVGAGVIRRRGRILLCKRRADAMLGGLWEFPGGKRHRGETIQNCIRRELMEECALSVTVGKHLVDVTHTYTRLRVTLRVYHCRAGRERVKLLGCADARWVRPREISRYRLPAADVKILEALFRSCFRTGVARWAVLPTAPQNAGVTRRARLPAARPCSERRF